MANQLYDFGRESFLLGNVNWSGDTIKVVLIDHGNDTPLPASDQYLSDLAAAARVATSAAFTSKTTTAGVADAADVTITSVSGNSVESLNIFQDTGTETTSILIAYIDTATGLPYTPNGGDVTIQWDNGANRIFKL